MWEVAQTPEEAVHLIKTTPHWDEDALKIAVL